LREWWEKLFHITDDVRAFVLARNVLKRKWDCFKFSFICTLFNDIGAVIA